MFFIFLFSINIIFYYVSDDYKFFLKKIKNPDEIIHEHTAEINDEYKVDFSDDENFITKVKTPIKYLLDDENTNVVLWKKYKDIINLFSEYELKEIAISNLLFDITNEYPDEYYEFYSKDFRIYFFPTKNYNSVLDIFNVLELELPIEINEANNFWNKSFYINLEDDIDDNSVRIIIENDWIVFWIQVSKKNYNKIKTLLNNIKK